MAMAKNGNHSKNGPSSVYMAIRCNAKSFAAFTPAGSTIAGSCSINESTYSCSLVPNALSFPQCFFIALQGPLPQYPEVGSNSFRALHHVRPFACLGSALIKTYLYTCMSIQNKHITSFT